MLSELLPFHASVQALPIAGTGVWAIALYVGFYTLSQWIVEQLSRWFSFAERSLSSSAEEFDKTHPAIAAQHAFWASLCSIIPFLGLGGLLYYGITLGLGQSWSLSMGLIAIVSVGIYELGRRNGGET